MWCAIAVYVVAAAGHARLRRASISVQAVKIEITDTSRVVTAGKVRRWLAEDEIDPIGRSIDSIDTRHIERRLALRPEVRRISVWTDLEGTLSVRIEPRTPAMRVRTGGGYRFWFTDDGVILPDRGEFTAYVPVVTGSAAFPFDVSAEGSYAQMQEAVYRDYLERFTAIASERRELLSQLASVSADIRTERASTPKRLWSAGRKKTFAEGKAARIAVLEGQRAEIAASIAGIGMLEEELRKKEKKSYQSHRFLSKLANFVGFIRRDDFWASQIVQINIAGDVAARADDWREPQIELIPRAGDHIVLLGELDGTERQRLENLRLFYAEGLWHEGWEKYGYINIKYGNQIVCTK